jgi:tetratricopeptide (TPR) repeat protein
LKSRRFTRGVAQVEWTNSQLDLTSVMPHLSVSATKFALRLRAAVLALAALAAAAFNVAAQTAPQQPASDAEIQSHFAAAQQAQRQSDYATAEKEYKSVIALAPEFAEVHMNLGLVYQLQNRYPEAMAEFRRALKLKPSLTGANFFLGVDYCKMGEGPKAVPYLKTALKASPNQPEIWLSLATAQQISETSMAKWPPCDKPCRSSPRTWICSTCLGMPMSDWANKKSRTWKK